MFAFEFVQELEKFHLTRSQAVLEAGAQILAFETIADLAEAQAICSTIRALAASPVFGSRQWEAWITFTCRYASSVDDAEAGAVVVDNGDTFEVKQDTACS